MTGRSFVVALVFVAALPFSAVAQVSQSGLIDTTAARQLGLERMWFTQIGLDRARGGLAGVHQHVSTSRFRIVFEFFESGVRYNFSARELEGSGRPLRDVAVLAVLEDAPPANAPPGPDVPKAKFRVLSVAKGEGLAAADQILELPYVGDSRKGTAFLILGSEIIKGATPPLVTWGLPLSLTTPSQKYLASAPDVLTPGVDRALQAAEQELSRIKLTAARLNPKALPADDKLPQIDTHIAPDITLYAASERGMVHALDGETGRTLWTTGVGNPQFPTTAPGANDDFAAVVNGSQLYVMKTDNGEVLWNHFTAGAPGAGPAVSETLVFIPMISGAVESFYLNAPKRSAAVFRSFGRAMIQPTLSARSVAWPTDKGNLYVGNSDVPDMRFRLEAKDTIDSAPAFLAPDLIFATSLDGYVYCFTETRGIVLWKFTTGEPISNSPVALGDTVYAITDRGNMYAINVEDASEKWLIGGIKRYLAGNERRLYCIDHGGNLAILDAKSGGLVGTLPTTGLDLHILNSQTDRILIGNKAGMLQCLRESGSYWPVVHYGAAKKKKPAPQQTPGKPGTKPGEAGGEAGGKPATDPFGTPAGAADPFAAPAAAPGGAKPAPGGAKPAPKPPAPGDPFAAPPAP